MSKTIPQRLRVRGAYPVAAIRILSFILLWIISFSVKGYAGTVFLSDKDKAYSFFLQHTTAGQVHADMITVYSKGSRQNERYFLFTIFGFVPEWDAAKINNPSLNAFVKHSIRNRQVVNTLRELEQLCGNKHQPFVIDTLIIQYQRDWYMVTNNIRFTFITTNTDDRSINANGQLMHHADSGAYFINIPRTSYTCSLAHVSDSLIILGKSPDRDRSGFTLMLRKGKGMIACKQEPFFTNKKDMLLLQFYMARQGWDNADEHFYFK
jgi:hypothetical protein